MREDEPSHRLNITSEEVKHAAERVAEHQNDLQAHARRGGGWGGCSVFFIVIKMLLN